MIQIALIYLLSYAPSSLAQSFTSQGCLQKSAQSDQNGRNCDQLSSLTEKACSSEEPIELSGSDQALFDQAQSEKRGAWQDVRRLEDEGQQSMACEARRRGSTAEKTINEVKARNCQQLIQRCESSCRQMQQCASQLASVTERLGRIGSSYGSYTSGLRQDAQRARDNSQQCGGFRERVAQAKQQGDVHGRNRDVEVVCRDGTKKQFDDSGVGLQNVNTAAQSNGLVGSENHGRESGSGTGHSHRNDSDRHTGENRTQIGSDQSVYISGTSGSAGRGPASQTHGQRIYHGRVIDSASAEGSSQTRRRSNSRSSHLLSSGAIEVESSQSRPDSDPGKNQIIRTAAHDAESRLGGRASHTRDGITPANGPDLFSKIRRRFLEEDRIGNWDPR